jgi:hypothetical protein
MCKEMIGILVRGLQNENASGARPTCIEQCFTVISGLHGRDLGKRRPEKFCPELGCAARKRESWVGACVAQPDQDSAQLCFCGVSHHTPARYLTPARNLAQRDNILRLFLRGLDSLTLHGFYFGVLAVPQLWPLPRLRSIVQHSST